MRTIRTIACAVIFGVVFSQASCVSSVNPLVEPDKCTFDDQLAGAWKVLGNNDPTFVFIGRPRDVQNRPEGLMVLHDTTFKGDNELSWIDAPCYVFPVKLGENRYLQFVDLKDSRPISKWEATSVKNYMFLKYQITQERLTIWFMDKDAAKKAIEDGVLKGTVKENKTITSPLVTLTETSEGLRTYLGTERSTSLFPDKTKVTLDRVK